MSSKLPSLVQPFDYYPLLLFHVGGDEDATTQGQSKETSEPWDGW